MYFLLINLGEVREVASELADEYLAAVCERAYEGWGLWFA